MGTQPKAKKRSGICSPRIVRCGGFEVRPSRPAVQEVDLRPPEASEAKREFQSSSSATFAESWSGCRIKDSPTKIACEPQSANRRTSCRV